MELTLLVVMLLGCGGSVPSALDSCKDSCLKQGDCTKASKIQIFDCQNACDAMSAKYQDQDQLLTDKCNNADAVRAEINDCYNHYCDPALAKQCADAVVCDRK